MKVRILAVAMLAVSVLLTACGTDTAATSPHPRHRARHPRRRDAQWSLARKTSQKKSFWARCTLRPWRTREKRYDGKLNLGGTDIAQAALVKGGADGGIDLYPEYTSTGLIAVLKEKPINDPEQAYEAVKKGYKDKFQLTWLDKTPMNDTQAMVTSKEISEQKGIKSLEDLCAKAGDLTIAARAEFKTREDALPALQKTYGGCKFKDIKVVEFLPPV